MRFEEVLDPAAAAASEAERAAARERWVAEMQARADPKQIRRAAREREERQREAERQEEEARRQARDRQWHEREARQQALQQERTAAVNRDARQHWAGRDDFQAAQPSAEPVMPPEDVDFGAVRRRLSSLERAGADVVGAPARAVGTPPSAAAPRSGSRTRSGALALNAQAAREEQLRQQRQHEREVSDRRHERQCVIAEQEAELQLSLLHDQVKSLGQEREELLARASPLREALEASAQKQQHAQQRLSRYGDNPKLRGEQEEAQQAEHLAQVSLVEIEERLIVVEGELRDRQEMLTAASVRQQ